MIEELEGAQIRKKRLRLKFEMIKVSLWILQTEFGKAIYDNDKRDSNSFCYWVSI